MAPSPRHQEFLIDAILPKREVSLLAGPSGAGKTTFLAQEIFGNFWEGRPVLGRATQPCPLAYVSCDRSADSVRRMLDRHGIPHDAFPWISDRKVPPVEKDKLRSIIRWAREARHQDGGTTGLLVIDGLPKLVPGGRLNDYESVANFLTDAQFLIESYDMALLGVVGTAKTKESDKYLNPRQRVSGSISWGHYSDAIFLIEPSKPNDPADRSRVIYVLPRDSAEFSVQAEFRGGRLVYLDEVVASEEHEILLQELAKAQPGSYSAGELHELVAGATPGLSRESWREFLESSLELGMLRREGLGRATRYIIVSPN